jgi:hypothetical protein
MITEKPIKPVKTYAIPMPLLQEVVSYLQTKPWHEVNPMIAALMNIVQAESQGGTDMLKNGRGADGETKRQDAH